ncbi:MAG: HlyD family secretion protein [Desulfomonile tiedjei]|nr:HlyD family secretion protein [Desulfomonile tiedjei]
MNFNMKSYKLAAAGVAVFLLIAGGVAYFWWASGHVSTDDAYVDGNAFVITPRISGYVTKLLINDNELVKKGQPLVILDPTDYEVAVAQAKANLADSRATLTSLELGVPLQLTQTNEQVRGAKAELNSLHETLDQLQHEEDAAAQNVQRLEAQVHLADLDLARQKALRQSGAVPQQALDNAVTNEQSVLAQLRNARASLEAAKKQRAAQESDIELRQANIALAATGKQQAEIKQRETDAQKAKMELAKAQLRQSELNLTYATIKAPVDGYITNRKLEVGQFVSPGQQLFAVVPLDADNTWITANYKETELTNVRPGQPVTIDVDTYPGLTIKGRVDSMMAGTGAVFSLFPPENATGNFVKVVQRIPVKITIDKQDWKSLPTLRMGMSVVPTIITTDRHHGKTGDKQMAHHNSGDVAHAH